MHSLIVKLPLPFYKKKSGALMTMNVFRNAHYRQQSAFKRVYGELCAKALYESSPKEVFNCISIQYILHTLPTKGKPIKADPYRDSSPKNIDLSNLLSMVDKVFSDVLVQQGGIPDDTITYIQSIQFTADPWADHEGVTVIINETEPKQDPRRVQCNNT